MAKQPFEPSEYPHGERQLDIARTHVQKLQKEFGGHFPESVTDQLEALHGEVDAAISADDAGARKTAIENAHDIAEQLRDNSKFNPTLSNGVHRRVQRMLVRAKAAVETE